jgi:hypothetical protein
MASVTLYEKRPIRTVRIEQENDINTSFRTGKRISLIEQTLPFRIKLTAIQVPGYGPNNVPPIPLQIIGYTNYIL